MSAWFLLWKCLRSDEVEHRVLQCFSLSERVRGRYLKEPACGYQLLVILADLFLNTTGRVSGVSLDKAQIMS